MRCGQKPGPPEATFWCKHVHELWPKPARLQRRCTLLKPLLGKRQSPGGLGLVGPGSCRLVRPPAGLRSHAPQPQHTRAQLQLPRTFGPVMVATGVEQLAQVETLTLPENAAAAFSLSTNTV